MKYHLLDGLRSTTPGVIELTNSWHHLVGIKYYDLEHIYSNPPGSHLTYETPELYDSKYGYWLGDDPFET